MRRPKQSGHIVARENYAGNADSTVAPKIDFTSSMKVINFQILNNQDSIVCYLLTICLSKTGCQLIVPIVDVLLQVQIHIDTPINYLLVPLVRYGCMCWNQRHIIYG